MGTLENIAWISAWSYRNETVRSRSGSEIKKEGGRTSLSKGPKVLQNTGIGAVFRMGAWRVSR